MNWLGNAVCLVNVCLRRANDACVFIGLDRGPSDAKDRSTNRYQADASSDNDQHMSCKEPNDHGDQAWNVGIRYQPRSGRMLTILAPPGRKESA